MGILMIRHKMKDYSKWRPAFDQHVGAQKSMLHEGGLGLAVATKSRRLMATHAISSACASP